MVVCASAELSRQDLFHMLPDVTVPGATDGAGEWSGELHLATATGLAEAPLSLSQRLATLPGVAMQRRGHDALEPAIRGLGGERVVTAFNGMPLPAGAPTATAAPVGFMGAGAGLDVSVSAAFPSVAAGPVPTAGRIDVRTAPPAARAIRITAAASGNPGGWQSSATASSARSAWTVQYSRHGDYTGGGGQQVDADHEAWSATVSGTAGSSGKSSVAWALHHQHQDKSHNSSLPLDTHGTDALIATLEAARHVPAGEAHARAGFAVLEPRLGTGFRSAVAGSPLQSIDASASARCLSLAAGCVSRLDTVLLEWGADAAWQARDATRWRVFKDGRRLSDHLWPDIRTAQGGVYAQLGSGEGASLRWRAGGRLDRTSMSARAVGGSARSDWTGAVNALAELPLQHGWALVAGAGLQEAPPGPGERYRSYVSALGGGFETGNPDLQPERKRSASLELRRSGRLSLHTSAWIAGIDGFILRSAVTRQPLVYTFLNRDARLRGLEAGLRARPLHGEVLSGIDVVCAFSRTEGEETGSGRGIPEIPPWEGVAGVEWDGAGQGLPINCSIHLRHVGARSNPQPDTEPVFADTRAFTTVDAALAIRLTGAWRLTLGVVNLADQEAYAYLQPPVAPGDFPPSSGSLKAGDRIPVPGRQFYAVAIWEF